MFHQTQMLLIFKVLTLSKIILLKLLTIKRAKLFNRLLNFQNYSIRKINCIIIKQYSEGTENRILHHQTEAGIVITFPSIRRPQS